MAESASDLVNKKLSSISEQKSFALESPLVALQSRFLLILLFQLNQCVLPLNSYNLAILDEFIENYKFNLSQSPASNQPEPTAPHPVVLLKRPGAVARAKLPREPNAILLLKLLLCARIDLLRRVLAVLERDIETLQRLADLQSQQMRRLKANYEDLSMRMGHVEKFLQNYQVIIVQLTQRIDSMVRVSVDGSFVWCIDQVKTRRKDAINGKQMSIYSPAFFVHRYGYKMCLRLYLNGDGLGKSTNMSLFVVIMRSPYDALLRWPFRQKITLQLYDQNHREHIIDAFKPDDSNPSFQRPQTSMNIASGSSLFVPLPMLCPEEKGESLESAYIKDDRLYIKVVIDCADLPLLENAR